MASRVTYVVLTRLTNPTLNWVPSAGRQPDEHPEYSYQPSTDWISRRYSFVRRWVAPARPLSVQDRAANGTPRYA